MNTQFDELAKSMAQSVTRRAALKKFGVGLAGMTLAALGLANNGNAQTACLPNGYSCTQNIDCCSGHCRWSYNYNDWTSKKKWRVWSCAP